MMERKEFERLVIAAYRLPFKFSRTRSGVRAIQNSGGLVSAILALSENFNKDRSEPNRKKIVWTGVADPVAGSLHPEQFENEHFQLAPVPIGQELDDKYYGGFCNDLIWPLFHYFTSYCVYQTDYFDAYREANERFCDEIARIIRPGDFIWVHDYQLLLLPGLIRERFPDATIGFFLHIPFPSYEIFRMLPSKWREALLNGMLGADLIGFHTNDYTQHFLKCVRRTTGFECRQNIVYTPNRLVKADAFPIGIDYDRFHKACLSPGVKNEKRKIRANLPVVKLIFSVDRLDYSKGLLLRLKGYETFLERYPQWHGRVSFNMVVVPSRDKIDKYREMKKEIESAVGRINGKYSSLAWLPLIYQYKSLTFNELVALYDASDVGLITPLRDGMNLVAKEYIACQVENQGVLILSEMAGAAAELNEAVIINPVDHLAMAEAIYFALEMELPEKSSRLSRMQNRIANYDVFSWAHDFFNETFDNKAQQRQLNVKFLNPGIISGIMDDYDRSTRRMIFLDYDGTLVAFSRFPDLAVMDKQTRKIIRRLAADPCNQVVIISGRNRDFLERQFSEVPVTLVAEHGYFIRRGDGEWETSVTPGREWKSDILPILNEYVSRCHGTFIEEKAGSVAWHYRNAESDFAQLRLNELRDDLAEIIRQKGDFEILEGNKVLEVKLGHYDKGQAAGTLIRDGDFDFILAAGDDQTDEYLFRALPEYAHTIRVGLSPSLARYNIPEFPMLIRLLKDLGSRPGDGRPDGNSPGD